MVVVGVDLIALQFIYPETEAACHGDGGGREGLTLWGLILKKFLPVTSRSSLLSLPRLSLGRVAQDIGTVPTIERISMLARGRANVPSAPTRSEGGGAV